MPNPKISYRGLYVIFAVGIAAMIAIAQSTPSKPVGGKGKATWVSPTTDVEGNPETLASAELAITASTVTDFNVAGTPLRTIVGLDPDGTKGYVIAPLVAALPRGPYRVWVRVADDAGNLSAWSLPCDIVLDAAAPQKPTGVSCK